MVVFLIRDRDNHHNLRLIHILADSQLLEEEQRPEKDYDLKLDKHEVEIVQVSQGSEDEKKLRYRL